MKFWRFVYSTTGVICLILTGGCHGDSSGVSSGAEALGSNDTITVSPSVPGTVSAVAGGGARTVAISFNTSDGKPIASLRITSNLAALPGGWTAPSGTFSCASVSTGNGCTLNMTFTPIGDANGTLSINYSYTNNAGTARTGTLSIPYSATIHNNVVANASPSGQIGVLVSATEAVNVNFTTDDGNPATALTLTTSLSTLPSGWSSSAASFACAKITTGNGCELALSFAPSAVEGGTLSLEYSYTDNAGTAKTGSVSIPYAGTLHDNVVATASPSGQVGVLVNATQAVNVNFTTDDGNPATELTLTTSLSTLPSGWSSSAATFTCPKISTGNGCQLALSFAPSAVESGTLSLVYRYADNAGTAKTGSVNIPYAATTHDNVVATASPSGQVGVLASASQAVTVNFTTDDGNPATALTLTTSLSALPSDWSSSSSSFSCATISTGNGCQLALTFAPSAVETGTLSLQYSYTDNAGTAQTGSVSIPYAGTTHNNVVAAASPSGTVTVNLNATQAVSVTFTTDDGNPVTALSVTSNLTALPAGWSSASTSFTCASVTTGSACQLSLSFAPSTGSSGTLTLNYGYNDNAGTAQTGSVSIPYAAISVHAYVSDIANGVLMCSIGSDGGLSNCASAGSGVTNPVATVFSGSFAFVSTSNTDVYSCALASDGTLSSCASAVTGFAWPGNVVINGGYLYIPNLNAFGGPTACVLGSGGSLTSCTSTNAVGSQNQAAGVAFISGFAYVATVGDQSLPGILLCTPGSGGTLSACTDAGSGLTSANSVVVAGTNIYVTARSQVYLCTAGVSGALSCTAQSTAVGSGSYYAGRGGVSIYNGFAYITYNTINITGGGFFVSYGVEACSVGVDGTLSNCATTGSGFSNPFSVAIH
jgi:hypothetical protein